MSRLEELEKALEMVKAKEHWDEDDRAFYDAVIPEIERLKKDALIRDKYCIGCVHILTCKGKPRGVVNCVCREEKTDEHR